jgi:hypothetical protein
MNVKYTVYEKFSYTFAVKIEPLNVAGMVER